MRQTKIIRPEYSERFRCIGPDCEDSCCTGWSVAIDQPTYEKYQTIPAGPLRTLIDANILRKPAAPNATSPNGVHPNGASPAPGPYAEVRMPPSLRCPFHSAERLCQIQVEHGASYLSHICATFPRTTCTIDKLEETTLTLSCPEAARLVLLDPHLLTHKAKGEFHMTWDDTGAGNPSLRSYFWPIREFAIALVRNRAYPLWQRLFLLGTFCRRLDAIARGEGERGFPTFFRDFAGAIEAGTLRASMETIPADLALQLDMLLRLVKLRLDKTKIGERVAETLRDFSRGIGLNPAIPSETYIAQYATAYRRHYVPFFQNYPYILENYLVHMIFRGIFPFGPQLFEPGAGVEAAREFSLLATKFALIKGLLIGVAGYHQQAFSTGHVVQTVQSIFKHFEHNPKFVSDAQELLVSRNLNNAHGLTMLLRN